MANIDNPTGFKPLNGKVLSEEAYVIENTYGTALYIGDPVVLSSGYLVKATAGTDNQILGHITRFECDELGIKAGGYYPASSAYNWKAIVADNPFQKFIAQCDGGGTLSVANVGSTVNLKLTHSGNTSTNMSGAEVDSSATDGAVTDQYRIVGLAPGVNNAWGANQDLVVEIHNHQLRQENNVDATS